jgi:membrane protein implicated in regulation of membrane protease activity
MHPALIWMIVGLGLLIIEMMVGTFFLMWIGAAALLTALLAAIVPVVWVQGLFFALASVVLLLATRPLARSMHGRATVASNVDSLMGAEGIVTQDIDTHANTGRVRIRSEDWRARSTSPIPEKTRVIVYAVEGTTLMVSPSDSVGADMEV